MRYADDFVILLKSQRAGERVMKNITGFLRKKLKLVTHESKSKVTTPDKSSFLGFVLIGKQIRWEDKPKA